MKKNILLFLLKLNINFFLNCICIGWIIALISYLMNKTILCISSSVFVVSCLIFYLLKIKYNNNNKLKNKKNKKFISLNNEKIFEKENNIVCKFEKKENTLISKDTILKGDVIVKNNIHISGKIYGNIEAKENVIYILQTGIIEGNLLAKEIIIDGKVNGICQSSILDILEYGKLFGIIKCDIVTIKKGGKFIGKSENLEIEESKILKKNKIYSKKESENKLIKNSI
ncbi:Wg003 [Wigglesworthia glossinidia endosymbiont of Glossina brevipalpis]|uniref:Wg003 protein n=1 Tax=Wigglesworthia glossinidia brevipalpis TaxID=36870 RepID=Q8D2R8_WIGBR|nr:Wg003 [Wigglesworthia glossinidia endosymbiont of Glossina brevipalpis]